MEFSGRYLTYDEYRLMGGTSNIMPFNLLEYQARQIIDKRTLQRIKNQNFDVIPQEVKYCTFEIIKVLTSYDNLIQKGKGIASESIDGYSVSYSNNDSSYINTKNVELEEIMSNYLSNLIIDGKSVMFLGVC